MKIAVIGAGWAGLAAAVELTESGASVTVFEAGRVAGGRARSVRIGGQVLDNGQHLLLGAYRDTLELMRRVGANPDELFDRHPLHIEDNDGFRLSLPKWPVPFNLACGLITARGIGWLEKFKTALWIDGLKRRRFHLGEDSTVAEWLDRAGQIGELRRRMWEPLCLAALNTPVDRASAQVFANVLRDSLGSRYREHTDLLLPKVPLGELLPEPAVRWLASHGAALRFSHRVRQVESQAAAISVDGEAFDRIIVSVAPQHLHGLSIGAATGYAYEPIATVYLKLRSETASPFPLFNLTGGLGQWVVDRGNGMLAAVLSGEGSWCQLDDAALTDALLAELGIDEKPLWSTVIREKRATLTCSPGLERLSSSWDSRIQIAGDHTWAEYPSTLEGAVRSGLQAARQLLGDAKGA